MCSPKKFPIATIRSSGRERLQEGDQHPLTSNLFDAIIAVCHSKNKTSTHADTTQGAANNQDTRTNHCGRLRCFVQMIECATKTHTWHNSKDHESL